MKYIRKINYYETDGMRVVHHSNYIRFLEEARCYMLEKIGLPYSEIENQGFMIPVLEVNCKYKFPARFNDIIEVETNIAEFNGIHFIIEYTIFNSTTNKVCATATTKHCFTNSDLKPVSIKKLRPDLYDNFSLYK